MKFCEGNNLSLQHVQSNVCCNSVRANQNSVLGHSNVIVFNNISEILYSINKTYYSDTNLGQRWINSWKHIDRYKILNGKNNFKNHSLGKIVQSDARPTLLLSNINQDANSYENNYTAKDSNGNTVLNIVHKKAGVSKTKEAKFIRMAENLSCDFDKGYYVNM